MLINQVGFAQAFEDAVRELAFVEAGGLFGFDGDTDLAGHFGRIGPGPPGGVELGTVGGERELDGSLRASAAGAALGSGAVTVRVDCAD